jgi:hypothetical protein
LTADEQKPESARAPAGDNAEVRNGCNWPACEIVFWFYLLLTKLYFAVKWCDFTMGLWCGYERLVSASSGGFLFQCFLVLVVGSL